MKKKILKALLLVGITLAIIPTPVYLAKITQRYAGIVMLTTKTGGGTGFHIKTPNGHTIILTNDHVCRDSKFMMANFGKLRQPVRVLKSGEGVDLCALEPIFEDGLSRFTTPSSLLPHMAAGYGGLSPVSIKFGTFVEPIFVSICTEMELFFCKSVSLELLDAYSFLVIGGHSGSPILNIFGKLTGVINAGNGIHSFAVPIEDVQEFIKDL